MYRVRRKNSVRAYKLSDPICADMITRLLGLYFLPEEISNWLKYENIPIQISICTIYRGLENGLLDPTLRKVLRIRGRHHCSGHKRANADTLTLNRRSTTVRRVGRNVKRSVIGKAILLGVQNGAVVSVLMLSG